MTPDQTLPNEPTDEDVASGLYTFNDLRNLSIVKDRSDLHRKQKLFGFPAFFKTGERQAATFRAPVHRWLKARAQLSQSRRGEAADLTPAA